MPNNATPKVEAADQASYDEFLRSMHASGITDPAEIREQAKTRGPAIAKAAGVKDPENDVTPQPVKSADTPSDKK